MIGLRAFTRKYDGDVEMQPGCYQTSKLTPKQVPPGSGADAVGELGVRKKQLSELRVYRDCCARGSDFIALKPFHKVHCRFSHCRSDSRDSSAFFAETAELWDFPR